MHSKTLLAAITTLSLATPALSESLHSKLAGKTFSNDAMTVTLLNNGAMKGLWKGKQIKGAWTIREGSFCRTVSAPAPLAGTECMTVSFNQDVVTFVSTTGRYVTYRMHR